MERPRIVTTAGPQLRLRLAVNQDRQDYVRWRHRNQLFSVRHELEYDRELFLVVDPLCDIPDNIGATAETATTAGLHQLTVPWKESRPTIVINMKDRQRIIWTPMVEREHQAAVPISSGLSPARLLAV
jgi:hypothetical protein